ncbi:hypothetical protein [Marinobacter sp. SS21]|uniref:hypothetical protein n=1 Tax=Marinobacter sp. SS21 TaxID=2979460 RepID=UPI00232E8DEA|nr:hypothetical protein [Marinobacter sp. SS21]MDC0662940.1 hypothetical protein [Marinobacter sp. SS21]
MTYVHSRRIITLSLLMLLLLVAASATGLWRTGNLLYSDWLFNIGAISAEPVEQVLLVTTASAPLSEERRHALAAELNRLGAHEVVLLPPSPAAAASDNGRSRTAGDRLMVTHPVQVTGPTTFSASAPLADPGRTHWVLPPSFEAGYFRSVPTRATLTLGGERHEIRPWFAELAGLPTAGAEPLYIHFGFFFNRLPSVSEQQVLAGEVVRELVEQRVVLLGSPESQSQPGYPVPGNARPLNQLEMQGLIWTTAANQAGLQLPSGVLPLLAVILAFTINLLIFQWLSPAYGAAYLLASTLLIAAIGWVLLQYGARVMPVVDLAVTQLASLLFFYQAKRQKEDQAISRMLAETNATLFERYIPEAFNDAESPWPKLVVFINQQLNLNRSILLERVEKDHRVREIQALNCSIDDIGEQRRDYERSPYSDALQRRGPLRPQRPFFNATGEQEREYLTPLIYAGDILGFWALTVTPEGQWSQEAFEANVASFAAQISELLYHRQQLQEQELRQNRLGRRMLALEAGRDHHDQLRSALDLLDNRLLTLEAVFDNLNAGAILYDLFGQILQANERARDIVAQSGLSLYNVTAVDLIRDLCELPLEDARSQLRHATLKRAEVRLPIRPLAGYHSLLLYIRPIKSADSELETAVSPSRVTPFKLLGLAFEFTDISQTRNALGFRDDLFGQLFKNVRNQISRITLTARLTANEVQGTAGGERLLDTLEQTVTGMDSAINHIEDQLGETHTTLALKSSVPINLVRLVDDAITDLDKTLNEKRLKVTRDWPFIASLIWADPDVLRLLISRMLTLLSNDAMPGSEIQITLGEFAEPRHLIALSVENAGYGLPQATLESIQSKPASELLNSDDPVEETLGLLKALEHWGGTGSVSAAVGKGFSFHLEFMPLTFKDHKPAP